MSDLGPNNFEYVSFEVGMLQEAFHYLMVWTRS